MILLSLTHTSAVFIPTLRWCMCSLCVAVLVLVLFLFSIAIACDFQSLMCPPFFRDFWGVHSSGPQSETVHVARYNRYWEYSAIGTGVILILGFALFVTFCCFCSDFCLHTSKAEFQGSNNYTAKDNTVGEEEEEEYLGSFHKQPEDAAETSVPFLSGNQDADSADPTDELGEKKIL